MREAADRIRTVSRAVGRIMAAGVLLGAGAAISYHYEFKVGVERRGEDPNSDSAYIPAYRVEPGDQLVMVYVGSSTCPWSTQPELPEAVETIKARLAGYARDQRLSLKAEGVALEWSAAQGMGHLAEFGLFDEVSAGYNWGNTFALDHLWVDPSWVPATPLLLVYRRAFIAPLSEGDEMIYAERDRRALFIARGLVEIVEWAEGGALFPDEEFSQAF